MSNAPMKNCTIEILNYINKYHCFDRPKEDSSRHLSKNVEKCSIKCRCSGQPTGDSSRRSSNSFEMYSSKYRCFDQQKVK